MIISFVLKPLILGCVLLSAGCATVDFDYPRVESHALTDTEDTYFGRLISQKLPKNQDGRSGFILLEDGVDAFALRLMMAEHAEQSIDAQYYLVTSDTIGYAFVSVLLSAADRGVRVRLLLDDIQTQGYDMGLAALDSHPNFEVRVFNPFASRSARFMDVMDHKRLNRRMHNKSFTVDNQLTIIGGRNIADEYFGANMDVNFGDLDVAGVGPIVDQVSTMFDSYWNSWGALPVPAFTSIPEDPKAALSKLRERIGEVLSQSTNSIYASALKSDYNYYAEYRGGKAVWSSYELAYDSVEKANSKTSMPDKLITTKLDKAIQSAKKELIFVSPYFVPLKTGERYLQNLVGRGLDVSVITNSLAANNHAVVHSGYMGSRKRLLKMGVKLYEVKATGTQYEYERVGNENTRATLHTKAFLVDRKKIFIGSFNWDPRSININTELGVIIDSEEICKDIVDDNNESLNQRTYEVVLNDDGNLRWIDRSGKEVKVLTKEPDTTWWKRFSTGLMRILPIKSQL